MILSTAFANSVSTTSFVRHAFVPEEVEALGVKIPKFVRE